MRIAVEFLELFIAVTIGRIVADVAMDWVRRVRARDRVGRALRKANGRHG